MLLSPLMYLGDESRESLHPKYQEWFVSTTQLLKSLVMETGFSSPSSNTLRLELECSSTNNVAMSVEQAGIKQTKAMYFLSLIHSRDHDNLIKRSKVIYWEKKCFSFIIRLHKLDFGSRKRTFFIIKNTFEIDFLKC